MILSVLVAGIILTTLGIQSMDAHIQMTDQAKTYLQTLVSDLEKSTG